MIQNIIGVFLFMIVTMIIYSWGIIRERRDPYLLQRKLWLKTRNKIVDVLKRNSQMDFIGIKDAVKHISVSNFGSRRKLAILEPEVFVKSVLEDMVKRGEVQIDYSKKGKKYYLE